MYTTISLAQATRQWTTEHVSLKWYEGGDETVTNRQDGTIGIWYIFPRPGDFGITPFSKTRISNYTSTRNLTHQ